MHCTTEKTEAKTAVLVVDQTALFIMSWDIYQGTHLSQVRCILFTLRNVQVHYILKYLGKDFEW